MPLWPVEGFLGYAESQPPEGGGPGPAACFPLVIGLPRAQGCLHSQAQKTLLSGIISQTQESTPCRKVSLHQRGFPLGADVPNILLTPKGQGTKTPVQMPKPSVGQCAVIKKQMLRS